MSVLFSPLSSEIFFSFALKRKPIQLKTHLPSQKKSPSSPIQRCTGDDPSWTPRRRDAPATIQASRSTSRRAGDNPGVALSVATPATIQASRSVLRHTSNDPKQRRRTQSRGDHRRRFSGPLPSIH
nr:hypothetical protein CFP56_17629 [Quercus suber]